MRVGISGHQRRPEIDWQWTARTLEVELPESHKRLLLYSSLAAGADQLMARLVLAKNGIIRAVIPVPNYERYFSGEDLAEYSNLLAKSERIELSSGGTAEEAFFAAGRYVVDSCELLFAVWDGKPALGLGGTADVVRYARDIGRRIVHVNPLTKTVLAVN